VKVFVAGGSGFIGLELVRQLRSRGDDVVAAIRSAAGAEKVVEVGGESVSLDMSAATPDAARAAMDGVDAVVNLAGSYRVGIPPSQHAAMYAANVVATRVTLDAAIAGGVPRIVHVSTGNIYGDTRRRVVDETYRRRQPPRFISYYDETKYEAHVDAERRIAEGAPIVIALPGGVYGPGDPSQLGVLLGEALAGTLRAITFPELGLNMVHVADVATGIIRVMDRGGLGEAYNLGGEITTIRELLRRACAVGGHRPPLLTTPTWLLRVVAPLGPLLGVRLGAAPNLAELISASDGVTYWISDARARSELGYAPRDLETGLRQLRDTIAGT
jgi:dihydroflavonol-4-reductase